MPTLIGPGTRGCTWLLTLGLGLTGCAQIATIGYEENVPDASEAPEDAATPAMDAAQERDSGPPNDSALDSEQPAVDASPRIVTCWRLPDVVSARREGGVQSVDDGVVFGATDEALGCLDGGMLTSTDPLVVTYSRRDNMPLLVAGQAYSVAGPTNSWGTLNFHTGEWCQQTPIPAGFAVTTPGNIACLNLDPPTNVKSIRANVTPTLWPAGGRLCDAHCGDPGLPSGP